MEIYEKRITPEERAKRTRRKKIAEIWLVKLPLVLWVLASIVCTACANPKPDDPVNTFLVVLAVLGALVLPTVGLLKLAIWAFSK